ncbi:MAG: HEAT repeat domain-containing protein [Candidatus Brocadiaceae bacterium]|nr:HEAT repeat domain-containing protein [Candidatus Brocadiaceae bacterium]
MTAFYNTIKKYAQISLVTAVASLPISAINKHQGLFADTPSGEEVFDIKFNNGQLSAKLKNSPLEKTLKEIMSQSGARIWLNDSIDTTVTIEFQNVSVREGVRRILKDKNYAFLYAPNEIKEGKLSIISASKSKEEPPKKPPPKPVQPVAKKDKPKKEKPSFEDLVKDALENEDAGKREDAIIALGESKDKKAIETIAKALANDPSEDVRLSSIDALLEIGDKSIAEPLSQALKDRDPWVRESAVEALGEVGGESAIEFIKSALNDEDGSVRELAQETLEELNAKK